MKVSDSNRNRAQEENLRLIVYHPIWDGFPCSCELVLCCVVDIVLNIMNALFVDVVCVGCFFFFFIQFLLSISYHACFHVHALSDANSKCQMRYIFTWNGSFCSGRKETIPSELIRTDLWWFMNFSNANISEKFHIKSDVQCWISRIICIITRIGKIIGICRLFKMEFGKCLAQFHSQLAIFHEFS